jgi:hypothetical protein
MRQGGPDCIHMDIRHHPLVFAFLEYCALEIQFTYRIIQSFPQRIPLSLNLDDMGQ